MDTLTPRLIETSARSQRKQSLRFELEIHDRQQIEVELAYPLLSEVTSTYSAELFLFIPRNVGVSRQNYKQETFYQDLTAYLRMDTPALTLGELADDTCSFSPLYQLTQAINAFEQSTTSSQSLPISAIVKLFGHSFRESVHTAFDQIKEQLETFSAQSFSFKKEDEKVLLETLRSFGEQGDQALTRFRTLRHRFHPLSGAQPPKTKEIFEHVHEYISAYFIEKLALLSSLFQSQTALHNGSCFVSTALSELHKYARQIAQKRFEEGFVNPDPNHPRTAEFFTYRRGLIKKSMQQTFYLETRVLRRDHFRRNIVAMLAAGLAAIWTLFLVPSRAGKGFSDWTSILVLVVVVLVYMLRDRTQELARIYLGQKLHYYDHDTAILGENLNLLGLRGLKGRVREKVYWTSPQLIPAPLIYLRTHPRTVAGTDITTEDIMCYERVLTLGLEKKVQLSPGFAVRDILRLNLRHFMTRLDDPLDEVSYYDLHQDRFRNVTSPKVYHLNLIFRVRSNIDNELFLSRHRIVLNKERILRIEKVEPS